MSKISLLESPPLPLAGNERIPLVQNGETYGADYSEFAAPIIEQVENAREAALAASNFIDGGLAAGLLATAPGDFFTVEEPAGVISYRVRLLVGSREVGTASTPSILQQFKDALASSLFGASLIAWKANGLGAVARTLWARINDLPLQTKDFGAICDGVADDTASINAAFNVLGPNGGTVVISRGISRTTASLMAKSNTTVIFDGSIKLDGFDDFHAGIMGHPDGATNVAFVNPQIDGNGLAPLSGIIIRQDNIGFRISGGYLRNFAHDVATKGGRGINIEVGTLENDLPVNLTISGTIITDSYCGISCSGGITQRQSNVTISNIAMAECESAFQFFGNSAGYPHDGSEMQYNISNISIRNCGKSSTYAREHGVFNADRASNVMMSNIYVHNDPVYGAVGSLFRGNFSNCHISDVVFEGDCTGGLLDFSDYKEATGFPLGDNISVGSKFIDIDQVGSCFEPITLPIFGADFLTKSQFRLHTDIVTGGKPGSTKTANKNTCRMMITNKQHNCEIEGFLSDIGSAMTFAQHANRKYITDPFMLRAKGTINGNAGTIAGQINAELAVIGPGEYLITMPYPAPNVSYQVFLNGEYGSLVTPQNLYISDVTAGSFKIKFANGNVPTHNGRISFSVFY